MALNSDVAFEILRYFTPIDRCRYRLINQSFNDAALLWWRQTSDQVDVGRSIADNRRRRSKILSFLQFLSKYCTWSIRRLINFSIDDQLLEEISVISDLRSLWNALESIELRCVRLENYDRLATFLSHFRDAALSELTLISRYPMIADRWDPDETRICSSIIDLGDLKRLHLIDMELKGDLLTALNPHLTDLIIDRCPDIDQENLATMAAWCLDLERIRLTDIDLSLDTFRLLCSLPRLSRLDLTLHPRIAVTPEWTRAITDNRSIDEATLTGRVDGGFGDLLDSCPWPMMINVIDDQKSKTSEDADLRYCLYLQNPKHFDNGDGL